MSEIKVVNKSTNELPKYKTAQAAGMDICAMLEKAVVLQPMERKLIPTGLYFELSAGTEAQVRPRSGLALKSGITVLNAPGTIDADYRGEIGVILINLSSESFEIKNGDRIAQIVIANYITASLNVVTELGESERGEGGFGSTGK